MSADYSSFIASKAPKATQRGFEPQAMPSHLFDFQKACVEHNLRAGSAGLFLDTGLGKTACQLEWARQCAEASNGRALILTPLAVARQIEREALRFGYTARVIRAQDEAGEGINICNYDRLDSLSPAAFGAVALDESSILKNFTGKTTRALINAFAPHPFRLSATATPAPNDHMELGQHAEFCGVMPSNEMLMRWFIADQTEMGRYRLKYHGVDSFWDWMASWARMAQSPEDLGFDGSLYQMIPLDVQMVRTENAAPVDVGGDLFGVSQMSAIDMHRVKRQTANSRANAAAGLVTSEPGEPWVVWCDTDYEADSIMDALAGTPGLAEVRGSHPAERKESTLLGFADGTVRVLVTKPSVCGFGLNWQHCARTVFVGRSFSYEAWYQAVRRFWRFGQTRQVRCFVVLAEGEDAIGRVIDRKAGDHKSMKAAMAKAMRRAREEQSALRHAYAPTYTAGVPSWLKSVA
jgi:hypothetical protein